MLASTILLTLLAAAHPVRLAAPGLTFANIGARDGEAYQSYFVNQMQLAGGVTVVTQAEIAALLGLERQKQLLGCEEASAASCMAELGGALGAEGLVVGNISKLGGSFLLDVKVVEVQTARTLALISKRVANEEALLNALAEGAREISQKVRESLRPGEKPPAAEPFRLRPWLLVGIGGLALAGAGSFFAVQASDRSTRLTSHFASGGLWTAQTNTWEAEGQAAQIAAIAFFSGAGAALITSAVLAVLGAPPNQRVGLVVLPGRVNATWALNW